jgi:YidC/Oxa1 family membrane protein insertase
VNQPQGNNQRGSRFSFFAYMMLFMSLFMLCNIQKVKDKENKDNAAAEQAQKDRDAEIAAVKAKETLLANLANAKIELPAVQPLQHFTLGSLQAIEKRPLIVTLSNRGASLDRVELVQKDAKGRFVYRSLDNRGGYPGYLAFQEVAGGLRIQSITLGTPAASALSLDATISNGLQVGDVLVEVDGKPVSNVEQYHSAIKRFDIGHVVRFTVLRGEPNELIDVPLSEPASEIREFNSKRPITPIAAAQGPAPAAPAEAKPVTDNPVEPTSEPKAEVDSTTDLEATADNNAEGPATETPATEQIVAPKPSQRLSFELTLMEQPLDVIRNSNRYPTEQLNGNFERASLLTTIASIDGLRIREGKRFIEGLDTLMSKNWEAKPHPDGNGVDFELPLRAYLVGAGIDADLTMIKSYRLKPYDDVNLADNYHVDYSLSVRNNGDKSHILNLRQEGISGLTLESWWYAVKQSQKWFSVAGARDVVVGRQDSGHQLYASGSIYSAASNENVIDKDEPILGSADPEPSRTLRYIGVDGQNFVAALLPAREGENSLAKLDRAAGFALAKALGPDPIRSSKATNVSFYFDGEPKTIAKDQTLVSNYRVFAGPKDPDVLENYGLGDTVYYGWSIFGAVARPLSWLMHFFYSIVHNYGIAIMMLTVLVRSIMFPFTWRASIMGQRMQALAPEMKRINEKYKDDMQRRGLETQKLYKKNKINPFASCLPLFLQLPIFIGLYRAVSTDIALRQKPLFPGFDWCSNLAGPDQFALWPTWMPNFIADKGAGYFGPYFNLLPILTCALFIVQQKVLMPKAVDEQQQMMQRIMMFMTVFMAVMFFKVPAGLCIYFLTSSIWSLIERRLVKKYLPKPGETDGTAEDDEEPETPTPPPAKKESRIAAAAAAKPPEKLSELLPWLKKQMQKPNTNGGNNAPAKRDDPRRKRKSK